MPVKELLGLRSRDRAEVCLVCMQEALASTLSTVLAGGDHGSQLEASLEYMSLLENHPWFLGSMELWEALSPCPQRLLHIAPLL